MFDLLKRRLRTLFRRDQLERELDDEMRFHLEKEIEQNVARGMSASDARTAALRSFGGVEQFKEEARDVRGVRLLEETWQDVRYGVRMLRKAPGFTTVAVLSLALGIGANTALFSVVDSVLLKTLPVKDPNRLVLFEWQAGKAFRTTGINGFFVPDWPEGMRGSSSFHARLFDAMRGRDSAVSDIFAFANLWEASVVVDGQAEVADGQEVSGGYFDGLGVPAFIGRTIGPADDDAAAAPAAMISYRYWQTRFGGDPGVIGKQIVVNKLAFTIVGVTPPGFTGTLQVDAQPIVTVPIAFEPALSIEEGRSGRPGEPGQWWVHLMGRLKPGATLDQARESLTPTFQAAALELMPPPKKASEAAQIEPKDYPTLLALSGSRGMVETRSRYSFTVWLLFGMVSLVLLIACANVANMLLARSASRGAEITLRLAMGAGRLRLVRQLLTESLLLSVLGGSVGACFALWGVGALAALGDTESGFLPAGVDYALSWRVLGFNIAVSIVTGTLFGLVPALRAVRLDLTSALKDGSRSSTGVTRSRLSKSLVVVQVAVSLVLLVAAGLFIRTVHNLGSVDVGFNQERLLLFRLQPSASGYKDERLETLYRQLFERLDAMPGVRSATFEHVPLIAHWMNNTSIVLPGETGTGADDHSSNKQIVRENYFETMEIPVLRGRAFTDQDDAAAPKVAVVSDEFAHKYFPDRDPIGLRVGFDAETAGQVEIVGVVRDTTYNSQREEKEPLIYLPWLQQSDEVGRMTFSLRVAGDPYALVPAVRQAVRELDADLPITNVTTQEAQSSGAFAEERVFAQLFAFFGALALLLAAIGLYGVMAYSVAQRTNEIGIRMALGAQTTGVLRLVIWQGLKLALVGLALGAAGALAMQRIVESQLFGVGATDPLTFASGGLVLLTIAVLACWVPARRATKVDPAIALRNE